MLANREKLSRALENLIFNAAEFTSPEGKITLSLEQDGDLAVIRIINTGCGIPEEELEKVFQRFYSTRAKEVLQQIKKTGIPHPQGESRFFY